MIDASKDFIRAMTSPLPKRLYVKLEIYDHQMKFIREITTHVSSQSLSSISLDSERPVRRSFSFSLLNKNGEYLFGDNETIWLDKRVKVYIGLRIKNEVEYIQQGVFIISTPSNSHSADGSAITNITGQDKAYLYTGNLGKFNYTTVIATDTKVVDAIKLIAKDETLFNFDDIEDKIPYELTFEPFSSKWDALSEMAKISKCAIYYDVNGYLRLRKLDLDNIQNEPTVWKYFVGDNMYAGGTRSLLEEKIANHITVLGGGSTTESVSYDLIVSDKIELWKTSPYTIERIGQRVYAHNGGSPDPVIITKEDCIYRAKYELMQRLGYVESVSMDSAPNFLLEVDDVIEIIDKESGIEGRHLVKSLNIPLTPQLMDISTLKENKIIDNWDFEDKVTPATSRFLLTEASEKLLTEEDDDIMYTEEANAFE